MSYAHEKHSKRARSRRGEIRERGGGERSTANRRSVARAVWRRRALNVVRREAFRRMSALACARSGQGIA
eukprot:3413374-Rhodomonas_salina.2